MRTLVFFAAVLTAFVLFLVLSPLFESGDPGRDARAPAATNPDDARLRRLIRAGKDLATLRDLFAEFEAQGQPDWADACLARILSLAPQDDWANERAGRSDLRPVYARIPPSPDLLFYPDSAHERLRAFEAAGLFWGEAEEVEYVEGLLAETTRHAVRLRGDPVYRDEWIWRTWMSRHPIFKDLRTVVEYRPPYLVFVQEDPDREGKARETLDRIAGLLTFLYGEFRELFADRFDLPGLPGQAQDGLRVLKTFVFVDGRTYQAYQTLIRDPVAPDVQAHYRLSDQWIVLYEGTGDEKEAAPGEADLNTQKVLFTGVQQLLHLYRKIVVERAAGEEVAFTDTRLQSHLPWFETGFARFLTTARRGEDGRLSLMAPNRSLLRAWRDDPAVAAREPVLTQMLEAKHRPFAGATALFPADRAASWLFTVRSWAFCHFLWHHADGKYRPALLDYLGRELRGESGADEFTRAFWGGQDPDWSRVEEEWRGFMADLLRAEGLR